MSSEASEPPPICRNCGRKIVGHNGHDLHVSPCVYCDSDGHAGCQHRGTRTT